MGRETKRSGSATRRRHQRVQTSGLDCHKGRVVDLSVSGMRVRLDGHPGIKPGEVRPFSIRAGRRVLTVSGRVAWVRRAAFLGKEFEFGVEFQDLPSGVGRFLEKVAMYGFVPEELLNAGKPSSATPVPPMARSPYEVLGVAPGSSPEVVHAAYRALARRYHPDICKEPDAMRRFGEIAKAYEAITELERKAGGSP